jgi:lycopene beta-cyclase
MIEDTYYTLNPEMDLESFKKDIIAYAESKEWKIKSIDRIEQGCTAVPMQADPDLEEDLKKGIPMVGMRGGIINPMTGYSAPASIGLADRIANLPELNNTTVSDAIKNAIPDILPPLAFTRLMDRMIFTCTIPDELHLLFQYFFNKSEGMVSRFFSGRYKLKDFITIFIAIPPPLPYTRLLWLFTKKQHR